MTDFPEETPYKETAAYARDTLGTAANRLVEILESGAHDMRAARELTGLREQMREAGDLLTAVLMRARARMAMDAHIIDQIPFAKLGELMDVSANAPSMWRDDVGPRFYLLIWPDGNDGYVMEKESPVRRKIARRMGSGAVVVPSRLMLDLRSDEELAKLNLGELYDKFKKQASYGSGTDRWVA
jgi:hypothetical protein